MLVEAVRKKFKETFDDTFPWTIYFLVDLKVVYIITFAFISTISLISSAANVHVTTDKQEKILLNVSSEYMNVNVTSINDAVLWNCRRLSVTRDYYKFFYKMVLTAMIMIMIMFLLAKIIGFITVSSHFGCKCCNFRSPTFKHGLTKLWHIAINKKVIELITESPQATIRRNEPQQGTSGENGPQQATSGENALHQVTIERDAQRTVTGENEPQQATSGENDLHQVTHDAQRTVTGENEPQQATTGENDLHQVTHDAQRTVTGENEPQQTTLTVEPQQTITGENGLQQVTAARSSIQQVTTRNDDTLMMNNFDYYDELLDDDKELDIAIDKLSCWNNFCRSIIPYLLLILLTAILCLAYLSFDLHPLACIGDPKDELITYHANRVKLRFSDSLSIFQKVAAILVFILVVTFVICVKLLFVFSDRVLNELQKSVPDPRGLQQPNNLDGLHLTSAL